jgi:SulP family sulfate permease
MEHCRHHEWLGPVSYLLGFGRLTRFVSYSVMTGFIIGIAVLTILSQVSTVTGYDMTGSNRAAEALDLLI